MDINSQQLVNTFVGGMNTDTSDALLESNQYRYAENLRLFTNTDSNSGELRLADGTEGKYVFETGTEILKLDKVRDIVTVITRKNNMWSVYLYKSGLNPTLLFGPCSTPIWEGVEYPNLSTILNYESESNIKLYVADGIHQIMVLKFSSSQNQVPVPSDIEILTGYAQVVLPNLDVQISDRSGLLKSAKVQYAYRLYKQGGAVTKLSPLSKVLSLYKDQTSGYASGFRSGRSVKILQPSAEFNTGTVPSGYFVNNKLHVSTEAIVDNYNVSPDRLLQIHINEISVSKYSKNGNWETEETRNNCYYIEDTLCTRDLYTDPLSVSEIISSYTNLTTVLGLDSTHHFEKSSDDDSTWIHPNSRLLVVLLGTSESQYECSKVMEFTYDDLLLLSLNENCITEGEWNSGNSVLINIIQRTYPLDGTSEYNSQQVSEVLDRILIFRINYVVNGQQPEVSIVYDGDYVANEEIIDYGRDDLRTISVSELLSYVDFGIIPVSIEVKDNHLFAANIKYSQLDIDDFFKDLQISSYFRIELCLGQQYTIHEYKLDSGYQSQHAAFRPGETYRFGIIFYDNDGNKSSVFPFGNDITMDDYSLFDWLQINTNNPTATAYNPSFTIKPPTIKIQQIATIPNCSKYEIVRCIRTFADKRTITQGLIGRPAESWNAHPNLGDSHRMHIITPRELFSLGEIAAYTQAFNNEIRYATTSDSNILCFASPEYVYLPDDIKDLLNLNKGQLSIKKTANYVPYVHEYTSGQTSYVYAPTNVKYNYPCIFEKQNSTGVLYTHLREYNSENLYLENTRNGKTSRIKFNHITPYQKRYFILDSYFLGTGLSNIVELSYPEVPMYNGFASGESLRFKDDVTNIANYTYIGWSVPTYTLNNVSSSSEFFDMLKNGDGKTNPIGTTGACVLVKVDDVKPFIPNPLMMTDGPFLITVADIYKNVNPYGGDTKESKKNSTYCSFGDVFENKVQSHILNSGDCYIRMFQYNALHNWFDTTFMCATKCGTVYSVPMFMDIDLHGQYGQPYKGTTDKGYYIQDKASSFDQYVQNLDAYLYNTAYNANPNVIEYSANTDRLFTKPQYDSRIHYSEQKTNNEDIDSWILFKAMNFLDVDSRFGRVSELKLFKDRLMFWQEHAFGMLAVNERVVLNDANDTQVVLGTGSVLDRYDYVSTVYGMKLGQHTACVSNDALYWWDSYNKEILQYVDKSSLTPLTQAKNIRNYINSSSENTHPHIYYNSKYKEVVCSCVNNQSVAYNELLQRFTSVYTSLVPVSSIPVNDLVYLAYMNSIYATKTNKGTVSSIFGVPAKPKLKCVVNHNNTLPKTFDIQIVGGTLYNSNSVSPNFNSSGLANINITYTTLLNQTGEINGSKITNREYDFRLDIPRETQNALYGGRLKGKTMQCELWSTSNSTDFSLQYITTKYRMSWS